MITFVPEPHSHPLSSLSVRGRMLLMVALLVAVAVVIVAMTVVVVVMPVMVIVVVIVAERQQEVVEHVVGELHSLCRAHVAREAVVNARPDARFDHLRRCVGEAVERPGEAGIPGALRVKVWSSPIKSASVFMIAVVITAWLDMYS